MSRDLTTLRRRPAQIAPWYGRGHDPIPAPDLAAPRPGAAAGCLRRDDAKRITTAIRDADGRAHANGDARTECCRPHDGAHRHEAAEPV
jgi:hypothetical protein